MNFLVVASTFSAASPIAAVNSTSHFADCDGYSFLLVVTEGFSEKNASVIKSASRFNITIQTTMRDNLI